MTDPAEIRAEGRRLREALWWTEPDSEEGRTATAAWSEWLEEHADVLLADPAPVGLTEDERTSINLVLTRQMVETDWVDTLRDADPPRCKVCLVAVAPPHNRCLSADWPNHHHVFGALP